MVKPKRKKQVLEDEIAEQCSGGKRLSCPAPLQLPPPSFFKIMLGDFTKVLFIPPKFTYNLIDHVNQNVYLKDCNEQSSKVKVSRINGQLAFQEGWAKFVVDHSINFGEFLVFINVTRALFFVKIFGISACERVSFGVGSNRETCRKNIFKTASLESSQFPRSCNGIGASKDEYGTSRKDPEIINDLSNSCKEIIIAQANDKGISKSGKEVLNFLQHSHDSASPHNGEAIDVIESLTNITNGQASEEYEQPKIFTVGRNLLARELFKADFDSNLMLRFTRDEKSYGSPIVACSRPDSNNHIVHHWDVIKHESSAGCSLPSVKKEKYNVMHASRENIGGFGSTLCDKSLLDTKRKTCQSVHDTLPEEDQQVDSCCQRNQNPETAKIEAVNNVKAALLPDSFSFSLTLPSDNWCCLELPHRLPFKGRRKNYEHRIVVLQDPSRRSWPIMYQANNKFTGFLSGWKNFATSNKLQQGNQCEFFVIPNEIEAAFQVKIIRP
ncbi:B3 domain-containing protein Os01g0905400-like isoform X1 [Zingiber officinale]|uniref:B3 domain-containing protein Os01g0905400-like isoform X1 n=1 Tax=Zingiber officinale TaxID=94328 RepID=UPI001C4BF369|nr:B3 domain-containing protein Os01g0905400-like isoform X1 [Zingiber officinale]